MGVLFSDTSAEVEEKLLAMLRQAPQWRKLEMVGQLNEAVRQMTLAGLRRQYPDETEAQLERRLADAMLGIETARLAYQAKEGVRLMPADPITVILSVAGVFEDADIEYVIVGSMASAYYGVGRSTMDVDFVADVREEHIPHLTRALRDGFYLDEEMIRNAIGRQSSFNLIHLPSMFKVYIFIPTARDFDRRQLERRIAATIDLKEKQQVYLLTPEDTVLDKLDWYNLGGRASDRQWQDILGVLLTQKGQLDVDYLLAGADGLDVRDLLERAFRESDTT